jgi:hypothetical protein
MHGGGKIAVLGIAAGLLFAGCLGDGGGSEEDGPEGTPERLPWSLDTSVSDCLETIGAILEDPAGLARYLPEGFTPRDSSDFFGLPAPSGRGLVFFNALHCPDGTQPGAEIGIYAHAPVLSNQSAVDYDLYTLAYGTADEEKLNARGYDHVTSIQMEAEIAQETALGVLASGSVTGTSASGMDYSFEVAAGAAQEYTLSARFWRVVPDGYLYIDYRLDGMTGLAGPISACTLSGVLATLVGSNSCTGEQALGLVFPAQTYEGTIHFAPHP